jgi:hypothetical protein
MGVLSGQGRAGEWIAAVWLRRRRPPTGRAAPTVGSAYAEKLTGSDGSVRWSNYVVAAGGLVGMHVENSDETVLTRYFHKDHLGSIASSRMRAARCSSA